VIAAAGSVVGIDVGYSARRRTTGLAVLSWDGGAVTWACATASSRARDRAETLRALTRDVRAPVRAVAVDGPLMPGLVYRPTYRCPEALLTHGRFGSRGKPGACNAGGGPRLHREATALARLALAHLDVAAAGDACAIHERAVVEAFPNLFLGVLCDERDYPRPARARQWTDALFPAVGPRLRSLLAWLLPGREVRGSWAVRGHDAIAGFVCALAALCVAAAHFVAVGSAGDGFIVLPPARWWGRATSGPAPWAERELRSNVAGLRSRGVPGMVYRDGEPWLTA
jgi:hypothetical protein